MIDQTSLTDEPAREPEIAESENVISSPADAVIARANERLALRAFLEGFCKRPADVQVFEFLFLNDRLEEESACELYEKTEALYLNLADALFVMGLLTPEERDELEALYEPEAAGERGEYSLRVNKTNEEWRVHEMTPTGLTEFIAPEWLLTAVESFPLLLDELERSDVEVEIVEHEMAGQIAAIDEPVETGLELLVQQTLEAQEAIREGVPFIGGWWHWDPLGTPEEAS